MNPLKILYATYRYRKWLSNGVAGLLFIIAGIIILVYRADIQTFQLIMALLFCGLGIVLCYICLKKIVLALLKINNNGLTNVPTNMLDIGKRSTIGRSSEMAPILQLLAEELVYPHY